MWGSSGVHLETRLIELEQGGNEPEVWWEQIEVKMKINQGFD
jgi:hypothetical protein